MDANAIVQAVEARMHSYLDAVLALDVDRAFSHYLRDQAMHVWNDGVRHDYDSWVALSRAALGGFRSLNGAWGDLTVVPLGADAAVASASFQERAIDHGGKTHHIRGAVSWVWVLRDGEWRIIHGHAFHQAG